MLHLRYPRYTPESTQKSAKKYFFILQKQMSIVRQFCYSISLVSDYQRIRKICSELITSSNSSCLSFNLLRKITSTTLMAQNG